MRIAIVNLPWYDEQHPDLWGVRSGSRWPHMQQRRSPGALPRYLPFPFMPAIAAGVLHNVGYDILLLDAVGENIDHQETRRRITAFAPDILFAEVSTPSLKNDLAALESIHQACGKKVLIACGGTHAPALVPSLLQKHPFIRYWLAGEYEYTLLMLCEALRDQVAPAHIPGLMQAGDTAQPPAGVCVEELPTPLYEQLPIQNYSDPVCGLPAPTAQSWISRGCPFGCTFCVWPQLVYGNRQYRTRPVNTALDEVSFLIENHGCESFYFDDDTTNIGEERMIALGSAIRTRGLNAYPWSMMARADCMTPRAVEALADAGIYSIKYGVESISPSLINTCGKATNLDRFHDTIRRTADAGIKMHLTFMFGIPGETPETIRESIDYCMETAPETVQFSFCTPFPGTVFYEECRTNGWLTTDDWSQYLGSLHAVINTPQLSAYELEKGAQEAQKRWRDFCVQRHRQRQKRLLTELVQRLQTSQTRWTLIGDRGEAAFLFENEHRQLLNNSFTEREENNALIVVVSRHDEERIYRRLIRRDPALASRILRLYTAN